MNTKNKFEWEIIVNDMSIGRTSQGNRTLFLKKFLAEHNLYNDDVTVLYKLTVPTEVLQSNLQQFNNKESEEEDEGKSDVFNYVIGYYKEDGSISTYRDVTDREIFSTENEGQMHYDLVLAY